MGCGASSKTKKTTVVEFTRTSTLEKTVGSSLHNQQKIFDMQTSYKQMTRYSTQLKNFVKAPEQFSLHFNSRN